MQIKNYSIIDGADMSVIQAWADEPNNRCQIIAQGRVGTVTHSLCVHQPENIADVITPLELALAGMIAETEWPE
jgi:hypothetical protein